ncbi:MAG: hypothetical protein GX340_01855 [Clostridiales bacterium]|jgi:hypothetical protein|nr:hypothetical protein [Clostridiales bacterium]
MKEKQILDSLQRSIDRAPIDILDKIKEEPRVKMLRHDDITRQETRKFSMKNMMSYASVAAVFLFVLFGWMLQVTIPDSRIYLDVNPSIEIVTNRQNKVIDLIADNLDGRRITSDLDYKGKTLFEVTDEILDRMMDESYLVKDREYLLLSVYNKDENKAEQQKQSLDRRIHEHLQEKELQPIVLLQKLDKTSTIEKYAEEYGISISRMTFIRNLIILNPQLKPETLVGLSIGELVRLSQGMELELDKIIDSTDFDKLQPIIPGPEPETEPGLPPDDLPSDDPAQDDLPKDDLPPDDQSDDIPKGDLTDDDLPRQPDVQDKLIGPDKAKQIALSVAKGTITDFDFDEDDLEYEVEIELGDLEYEIIIDARTGKILEIDIDD